MIVNNEIMRRYRNPQYSGDVSAFVENAPYGHVLLQASGDSRICGDKLSLALLCEQREKLYVICDGCYEGYGCSLCMASAEAMMEYIIGKSINEAGNVASADIVTALGEIEVPRSREPCVSLSTQLLSKALAKVVSAL